MKSGLSFLLIVAFSFCIACQPTPAGDVVVNKGEGGASYTIQQGVVPTARYTAPQNWTESIQGHQNTTYEINASITIPDVDMFPVTEVRPRMFSREELADIAESLFPDCTATLYDPAQMTKADIQAMINGNLDNIANVDKYHPEFNAQQREEYIARHEESILYWEKEYQTAPEEFPKVSVDSIADVIGGEKWVYDFEFKDAIRTQGSITLNITPKSEWDVRLAKLIVSFNASRKPRWKADNIDILNFDEVRRVAEDFVDRVNLPEYKFSCIYRDTLALGDASVAIFTKTYGNVAVNYIREYASRVNKSESYDLDWSTEYLFVPVSRWGIASFVWESVSDSGKVLNENVALLPFSDIQAQARKAFSYVSLPDIFTSSTKLASRAIVTEIRLGMMVVKTQDSASGYMAIPVWDFYGYWYDRYESEARSGWVLDENNEVCRDYYPGATSLLTLSAIDGSIIDRGAGY